MILMEPDAWRNAPGGVVSGAHRALWIQVGGVVNVNGREESAKSMGKTRNYII